MATMFSDFEIPAHVPPNLVRDFDFLDMGAETDVWRHWGELHNQPDIFYTPRNGGHWVLTRHDDIEAVFINWRDFSSRYETLPKGSIPMRIPPIEMDGPIHAQFRKLIAPYFTPKSISNLEVQARTLTHELIDRFQDKGSCDFVAEFAFHMPIGIFMNLADLPEEDRLPLLDLAEKIVRPETTEKRIQAFTEMFSYLDLKIEERLASPGADMISAVVTGRITDGGVNRALTRDEMLGMSVNLVAAGLDTVAGMMGFIMLHLATHPADCRRLVDEPGMVPPAIEEMMRRHGIANISRVVSHDVDCNGVLMKEGDMVLTATSVAGIDGERYDDPYRVDFDRADKKSLVFGRGPHSCIGAFLARTELRVMLVEWLKRIPEFSLEAGKTPIAAPGTSTVIRYLPLVWSVVPRAA